ncbi:pyruvate kinase [Salinisphaera sp. USBA-960]|uniref:pyruvate kinase n=1 Tax=Salinisphaera orenii TaxID=856731 RepID=UPI000DBE8EE6|nr:pyruvate kinase [Salifodinibacter halophilus]NNC26981.1 pyruvate kinase [Salifodinibacter halophilus]
MRKTKILATLGPACDNDTVLPRLLEAGVNCVRVNFSHGSPEEHSERAERVRAAADSKGLPVGILADLQGPKIRIESFADGAVDLEAGQTFTLDTQLDPDAGTKERVAIYYEPLLADVQPGSVILVNDGAISLSVTDVGATTITTRVELGGRLSGRKGVNLRGGGLSAGGLTKQDIANIDVAADIGADYLAVSFVRNGDDIRQARDLLQKAGGTARLCAKIERAEALDSLDDIIEASDAVMVARGDLGVEIGDPELPAMQKRIIARSREMNRLVITATQMMESMIDNPTPTRAEVLDVANATLDGTDAVMLSAESAVGSYPTATVKAMSEICEAAERQAATGRSEGSVDKHFEKIDEAIAMATMYTSRYMHADAIVALTESGSTAMLMSRQDSHIPIYALTQYPPTEHYLALCRNVYPIAFRPSELNGVVPVDEALAHLRELGLVESGHRVLLTKGDFNGPGGTNALKIVTA